VTNATLVACSVYDAGVCVCWQTESEYSMLLAVPCARDPVEVMTQGHNLRTGFINYLQQKHAAGIVNIQEPGSSQVGMLCHVHC